MRDRTIQRIPGGKLDIGIAQPIADRAQGKARGSQTVGLSDRSVV